MGQLGLNDQESEILSETVESFLSDLRVEIADTDELGFRESLKRREEVLRGILNRLKANRRGEA